MNIKRPIGSVRAFTIWDLLAIGVILIVGVWLLMPQIARPPRASRVQCVSNLKQTVLAFRMWANDHNEQFPMTVPVKEGGSAEFVNSADVFQHFLVVSNELNSPKVLACSDDKERQSTAYFTNFSNRNLSYFVNVDATQKVDQAILAGDRNITGRVSSSGYLMIFTNGSEAGFTPEIHKSQGNIGLVDGSVMQATPGLLRRQLESTNVFPIRFAIPHVPKKSSATTFWRSGLQKFGFGVLIGISGLIAIAVYAGMTRRLVARAASG